MPNEISLVSLAKGLGSLTAACGALMAEAASVCLEDQGHGLSMTLRIDGDFAAIATPADRAISATRASLCGDR